MQMIFRGVGRKSSMLFLVKNQICCICVSFNLFFFLKRSFNLMLSLSFEIMCSCFFLLPLYSASHFFLTWNLAEFYILPFSYIYSVEVEIFCVTLVIRFLMIMGCHSVSYRR